MYKHANSRAGNVFYRLNMYKDTIFYLNWNLSSLRITILNVLALSLLYRGFESDLGRDISSAFLFTADRFLSSPVFRLLRRPCMYEALVDYEFNFSPKCNLGMYFGEMTKKLLILILLAAV